MDNRLHVIGSWSHNQLDRIEGVESTNQKRSYLKHWGYVTNPSATGPALLTAPNVVPTDFGTTIQFNAAANNPLDRLVFDGSGQQFSKMPFYGRRQAEWRLQLPVAAQPRPDADVPGQLAAGRIQGQHRLSVASDST
jgi:hypothetical protein